MKFVLLNDKNPLTEERELIALSNNSLELLLGGGLGVFPNPLYRPP